MRRLAVFGIILSMSFIMGTSYIQTIKTAETVPPYPVGVQKQLAETVPPNPNGVTQNV